MPRSPTSHEPLIIRTEETILSRSETDASYKPAMTRQGLIYPVILIFLMIVYWLDYTRHLNDRERTVAYQSATNEPDPKATKDESEACAVRE